MQLISIMAESVHLEALKRARDYHRDAHLPTGSLYGPLTSDETVWGKKIWDCVEGALQNAFTAGLEAAQPLIDAAAEMIVAAGEELGERAANVRAFVSEQLNSYLKTAIDGALKRVDSKINIGEDTLSIASVSVNQEITVTGSLKASLSEVCSFVSSGKLSISAKYGSAND